MTLVRPERPADAAAIRRLHAAAFARADLDGAEPPEARLVDDLRASGAVEISLVALDGGEPAGHVVCSRASLDGEPLLGLGPLGVAPERQNRGIGGALMHAVLAAADALGEPAVVLLGEPAYYGRFGFEPAVPLGVLPPVAAWEPAFLIRTLERWRPGLTGTFRYAAPFDRV